jgi:tetratricopeptide (TPR) repeat protein
MRFLADADLLALTTQLDADTAVLGQPEAARRFHIRVQDLDQASALGLASLLMRQQRVALAAEFLGRCVQVWLDHAGMYALRGNALRVLGRTHEAEVALRCALSVSPAMLDAAVSLAFLLREQGRLSAAAQAMLDAWRLQAPQRETDARCLAFLRECQRPQLAAVVAQEAAKRWPDDAAMQAAAGEVAMELGDFAGAREHLALAAERDPARGATWLRLAHTHRFESRDDADIQAMRRARVTALGEDAQTCLCFALGKAYDDLRERDMAVQLWREGNARARAAHAWSAASWQDFVAQQTGLPELAPVDTNTAFRPVFVVGLPRTGTTLTASLLGRHPQLRNRGELNWLSALAARLGPQPDRAALAAARTLFAAQLQQDDAPGTHYLDKNPLNFRHLGLVFALFPQARVIHCQREARDMALSIWTQHFAHPDLAWSYDFGDIGRFASGERRLMQHWQQRFPQAIASLHYEDLVAGSEASMRRLQAFLGLPADAVAKPEETGGIRTASVWQARQPVNTRSVGRWRDYVEVLPELVDVGVD